jgi:single-stranded-DNA-specific exonuclease
VTRPPLGRRWELAAGDPARDEALAQALGVPTLFARLLAARGCRSATDARTFLDAPLEFLHDPFLMTGMSAAVNRLRAAAADGEAVLVCGDFDADGITGMALLTEGLGAAGARVRFAVPQRLTDGYGLPLAIVESAAQAGVRLLVTVDHGITAHEAIAAARGRGMDVLVCDHHLPSAILPPATAILNPRQPGCAYPCKDLCGVGIAFKLLQGLGAVGSADAGWPFLELVALGTVADLVPLVGENRILARHGLARLAVTARPGLRALMVRAGIRLEGGLSLTAGQVGFGLAPRLNAAGRLADAAAAVRLLLTKDPAEADRLAGELDRQNRERQGLEAGILEDAAACAERTHDLGRDRALVLFGKDWHPGVLGIVASRLADRLRRPVVLLARVGAEASGSVRGVEGFHVAEALERCGPLLTRHGGHRAAGGCSLPLERIPEFRERFLAIAAEALPGEGSAPVLRLDAEVRLAELDLPLVDLLARLGPHGIGNPEPVLAARGLQIMRSVRLVGRNHLKFKVRGSGAAGPVLEAIGFNWGELAERLDQADPPRVDLAFVPERNSWNGRESLQLRLLDIRFQA